MATSKMEVFDRFLSLVKDTELCTLLTDQDMSELLDLFLDESVSVRFKNCKKDLSDATPAVFFRQEFVGDSSTTSFVITQYPATPNENSISLFAQVGGTYVDYAFTEATKTFVLSATPTTGAEIVLGYDDVGQFNEDLTSQELWILAHGMMISWRSSFLNHTTALKNRLTSKDFKAFSPANLLEKLIELQQYSETQIRRLTVSYSFDGFSGFN